MYCKKQGLFPFLHRIHGPTCTPSHSWLEKFIVRWKKQLPYYSMWAMVSKKTTDSIVHLIESTGLFDDDEEPGAEYGAEYAMQYAAGDESSMLYQYDQSGAATGYEMGAYGQYAEAGDEQKAELAYDASGVDGEAQYVVATEEGEIPVGYEVDASAGVGVGAAVAESYAPATTSTSFKVMMPGSMGRAGTRGRRAQVAVHTEDGEIEDS